MSVMVAFCSLGFRVTTGWPPGPGRAAVREA
jgi:hypothetical protein